MIVDNRSVKEIKEDIKSRMLLLGRVVIMRRITLIVFFFTLAMSIYNIVKWYTNNLIINERCIVAILWLLITIISILLYNALQGFSIALKQEIFNDNKILSRL